MARIDKTYQELVLSIITEGYYYDDPYRKGVKRKEIPTYTLKHDLTKGFPAITTKGLWWKGVVGELLWFLRGGDNIKELIDQGIHIWDKDVAKFYSKRHNLDGEISVENLLSHIKQGATNDGYAGRIYGVQWRDWGGADYDAHERWEASIIYVDQIKNLIKGMIERPLATDLLVTAWNPAELANMALPPCHFGFQIVGRPLLLGERVELCKEEVYYKGDSTTEKHEKFLDERGTPKYGFTLVWDQRSVDTFLGLPFNIASYALLAHILAKITNMVPLEIVGNLRNVHIYDNAIDVIQEQMTRDVNKFKEINLEIKDRPEYGELHFGAGTLDNLLSKLQIEDFTLNNYESYPALKAEMLARD